MFEVLSAVMGRKSSNDFSERVYQTQTDKKRWFLVSLSLERGAVPTPAFRAGAPGLMQKAVLLETGRIDLRIDTGDYNYLPPCPEALYSVPCNVAFIQMY
uniref:SFRICE_018071 n=1 Tax=Spodoptera frugiperda TaxID=7108 RepID=A0A2H1V9H3_SPOFR